VRRSGERAALGGEHVAHGEAERVQIVLNAKKLDGVFAIAIDEIALEVAESADLVSDVYRIGDDGGESDDQTENQGERRRAIDARGHGKSI
jgi:hypothetical protein